MFRLFSPDPDPGIPTGGSVHNPPPPAPPAPPAPGTPPVTGDDVEPATPPKWLNMRLEQQRRSTLKQLGFETLEQATDRLKRAKELEDQEETRRLAALSELDREKASRAKAESDLAAERTQREQAERRGRLVQECAQQGVKNVTYAQFLVDQLRTTEPTVTEADAVARFLKDEQHRGALGLAPITPTPTPHNSAPPNQPPPPPPNPNAQPQFDAMKATPDEWREWRARNGMG